MPNLVRYTDEEWSALYIDGNLDIVGDSYLIDERIRELAKVEDHDSDAFMRGGNTRDGVARTLDDLHAYEIERDNKLAKAAELRAQAAALEAEAKALLSN